MGKLTAFMEYLRFHGARYTLHHGCEKLAERYFRTYDRVFRRMAPARDELEEQRAHPHGLGLFSILIPVYNTDPDLLAALLDSISAQTEPDWEACLYSAGGRKETREVLDRYAARDARFRVVHADRNEGISGNTNRALAMARGEFAVLCDHDDLLTPDALWRVADCFAREKADVVYTDEDKITEDGSVFTDVHLKPDFCPDTLRSSNYVCHLLAVRREVMLSVGGERSAYDGSQDHDLMLRLSEKTDRISHVRAVCYHWRTVGTSASHQNRMRCLEASCRAVEDHMGRLGWECTARPEQGVIRLDYGIRAGQDVDILYYGSREQWEKNGFAPTGGIRVRLLDTDLARYAAYNAGAAASDAEVLLFLDASVRGITEQSVREMLMYAQRPDVGGVTAALVDRRGCLCHAGFAYPLKGFAQCRQAGLRLAAGGWHILARQSHNVGAVSAACIMVRRSVCLPFDEEYRGGLGAVEWSIRMSGKKLVHVYTPHGAMVCTDRELLLLGEKRDSGDLRRIMEKAGEGAQDPCYHPWFRRDRADFRMDAQRAAERIEKEA